MSLAALLLAALFVPAHCQISIQIVNENQISCTTNGRDVQNPCFYREATGTSEPIEPVMGPGISLLPDSGRLIIQDPSPADEDIYWCCTPSIPANGCRGPFQSCSAPLRVYVPPARIESLPRNGTALIRSNFSLPCGIVRGRLSNSFTLQWDLMRGEESFQHILTYNSDLDNQTLQKGVFTFDPSTEVLHVQNLTQFNSTLDFQCRVTVNRRDGALRPATRSILVTIVYVKFRAKLPAATVTAHQTVLIQVQVQANGVHANVSWMINGQPIQDMRQDRYEIEDSHARDPMVYSTNSTLVIHEITDEDTTAMITACASLGDTMEDQSTTRLIVVPMIQNMSLMCDRTNSDLVVLEFSLPPKFPVFRSLTSMAEFNLTITLQFSDVLDTSRSTVVSMQLSPTHYGRGVDRLHLPRSLFPRGDDGVYRVQAKLIIDGKEGKLFSSLCNEERNIYPPTDCNGVGNSAAIEELTFDLSFPTAADCQSMNTSTVSQDLLSGLQLSLPHFCLEFLDPSFTCDASSGRFSATLLSYNLDAVLAVATSISDLPFSVTAVHIATPAPPVTTPTPAGQYKNKFISVSVAASVILSVMVMVGIIWWGCRRHKSSVRKSADVISATSPQPHRTGHTA